MAIVTVTQAQGWSAVVAAINAGDSVIMDVGTFNSASSTPLIIKQGQFLRGAGSMLTTVNFTGSGDAISTLATYGVFALSIEISGFSLDGTGSSPSGSVQPNGIVINGAWESEFRDLRIFGFATGIGFSLLGIENFNSLRNVLQSVFCGKSGKPNKIGIFIASPNFQTAGTAGSRTANLNTLINCSGNFNSEIGLSALGTAILQLIDCDFESNGDGNSVGTGVLLNGCVNTLFNGGDFENNPRPTQFASTVNASANFTLPTGSGGFQVNDVVILSPNGNIPAGFFPSSPYFVVAVSGFTFQLATSLGGSAITATSTIAMVQVQRIATRSVVAETIIGATKYFQLPLGSSGFQNGDLVKISSSGNVPTGFTSGTFYFVLNVIGNTFSLANPPGTTPLDPTTAVGGIILQRAPIVTQTANVSTGTNTFSATSSPLLLVDTDVIYLGGATLPTPLKASLPYFVRDVAGTSFNLAEVPGGPVIPITSGASGVALQLLSPSSSGDIEITGVASQTSVARTGLSSETTIYGPAAGVTGDVFLTASNFVTPRVDQLAGNWMQKLEVTNLGTTSLLVEGKLVGVYRVAYFSVRGEKFSRFRIFNSGTLEWSDGISNATAFQLTADPANGTLAIGGKTIAVVLKNSATIDLPSVAANSSAVSASTITVAGALTTDTVDVRMLGDALGLAFAAWVSSANTVSFRAINGTNAAINLASAVFEAQIVR